MPKILRAIWRETGRPLLIAAAVALLLWLGTWLPGATGESALAPLLTSSALVVGLAGFSHVTRRVFFPRLDLQQIALTAIAGDNRAAAIVFLGICLVLVVLIGAGVAMLG